MHKKKDEMQLFWVIFKKFACTFHHNSYIATPKNILAYLKVWI